MQKTSLALASVVMFSVAAGASSSPGVGQLETSPASNPPSQSPQAERSAKAAADDRVQLVLDTSEAAAALAILEKRSSGKPIEESDWVKLFSSEPYVRLKKREASLRRDFTDAEFQKFLLSEDMGRKVGDLRKAFGDWRPSDLDLAARRILPYLPADARVRAHVYLVIKPKPNSFVFETSTNPAIFLNLAPVDNRADSLNTVAHECHHIGFSNASKRYEAMISSLPENARSAAEWMGAFGEGLAVLAAAGSVDVHPLETATPEDRMRWDQDLGWIDDSIAQLDQFFQDLISGGFARPEVATHVAFTFFGYRGPWYTVGYGMGSVVERRFGRAVLIECMAEPRKLLARYNEAMATMTDSKNGSRRLWSAEVLRAVGAESTPTSVKK